MIGLLCLALAVLASPFIPKRARASFCASAAEFAAVDVDCRCRNEFSRFGCQESNGICDLLRPSDASNRHTRERGAVRFRFEGFSHSRENPPRRDAVDGDAVWREVSRGGACEADETGLGRRIVGAGDHWQRYADTARFLPTKTLKPEVARAEGAGKPV